MIAVADANTDLLFNYNIVLVLKLRRAEFYMVVTSKENKSALSHIHAHPRSAFKLIALEEHKNIWLIVFFYDKPIYFSSQLAFFLLSQNSFIIYSVKKSYNHETDAVGTLW